MAKQERLPGMTPKRIADLEDAAGEYVQIRDARMEKTAEENKANEKLVKLMKKYKLKTYPIAASTDTPARVITIEKTESERAKVRSAKSAPNDE